MSLRPILRALRRFPFVLVLALSACTIEVGAVAPRPTIALTPSQQRLALVLSPTIADAYEPPCSGCWIHIGGFRRSIENGFAASIARYYAPGNGSPDLTLRFETASLELVGTGGHVIVRYAAALEDREGKVLGRSFGTVKADRGVDLEAGIAEALALMFEKVAADCFVRPGVAS